MKNNPHSSIHHILKYISIFGSVEMLKIIANLARGKVTALLLGPFGTGLIAIYQNILELIRSCTNIGLETAGIRQLSEIDEKEHIDDVIIMARVIRSWSLLMAIIDILICVALFFFASNIFFKEGQHHWEILMFIPASFFIPITIGECAILKGTHKLKRVATVEVLCTTLTVLSTIVIYSIFGHKGIIPCLNICFIIEASVHLWFCTQSFPYRVALFDKGIYVKGLPLLKFGIPYAITSIIGVVTTTCIYHIITSTEQVGLYKAGYALIMYYMGVILSSTATDYFPRLTSVCNDKIKKNETVNKQINAGLSISTPIVMLFITALPLSVALLFTSDFSPIITMCTLAGLFQLHRSITVPLEYVSLAHGHSWMFFLLEGTYNIILITSTYYLYSLWGLEGIGIALSIVGVSNTVVLSIVNHFFYNISITRKNWFRIICTSLLVCFTMLLCLTCTDTLRYALGIPLIFIVATHTCHSLTKSVKKEYNSSN